VQEAQQVLWVGKRRSENCNREKRDLDADRRQRAIDAVWEQTLMEKRLQAEEPSPAENRDTRRFNSLEEAEQFAKEMRRTNRIYTELCPEH
jgi:coenzyme F420-reducing hydrogenase delta subunit